MAAFCSTVSNALITTVLLGMATKRGQEAEKPDYICMQGFV